ncbi:MAG: AI-2E family transporter [Spirochaeta sp.]|jgi:predicted PurR-regulated permease PerM|nr:AI-2E family transporter [Spirochaeta sp.]
MNRTDRLLLEAVFLVVLVIFSVAFVRIMQPFILAGFIALVLANIFHRPYAYLVKKTGRPRVAATLTILTVFVTVAVPLTAVVTLVTAELARSVANIQGNWSTIQEAIQLRALIESGRALPILGGVIDQFSGDDLSSRVREIFATTGDYLINLSQRSIGNAAAALLNFLVVLLLVFFFLLDGRRIVDRLYETIPISNHEIDQIVAETFSTTSATLISTIIIGLLEGALATVLFVIFGLPSPFFWGVVTMVLSMIPLIGSNLIIIPAGLVVLFSGDLVAGIMIIIAGVVGVAITQNLVKPKLVGDRSGLHPALALLSTIGGIAWLGLIGFLVGPVLASLFIVVWRQFARRYRSLLDGKNEETASV